MESRCLFQFGELDPNGAFAGLAAFSAGIRTLVAADARRTQPFRRRARRRSVLAGGRAATASRMRVGRSTNRTVTSSYRWSYARGTSVATT